MKPRQHLIISCILEYVYMGTNYTNTRHAIRSKFRMCETTFVKYWKIAQLEHWQNCKDIKKKVNEQLLMELIEYKKRYGEL